LSRLPDGESGPVTPLVIGVGNEIRGDDSAGLRVVRELRALIGNRVRVVESPGGVSELLDLWEGQDEVFLVDAVRSGQAPGTWFRVPVGTDPLPSSLMETSTHGLSVASAVALGQILGRMPRHLVVFGIEAAHFEPGAGLTPEVAIGVGHVTRALVDELGTVAPPSPAVGGA
jgi:hydrogenase maturation protease